jgi:hypothetical protein
MQTDQIEPQGECEAIDCHALATEQFDLRIGRFGSIRIFVCKKCVSKFCDESQSEVTTDSNANMGLSN